MQVSDSLRQTKAGDLIYVQLKVPKQKLLDLLVILIVGLRY